MADSLFDQALKLEGITGAAADFAKSIYRQESSGGANTQTSNAGAMGGMQIIPSTFKSVADKGWNISNPLDNARAGIRYATKMFNKADSDPAIAAAGYYGGTGALLKAKKGIAVSDPRNPNAPTTLEYGQQVVGRMPDPYLDDFMSRLKGTIADNKQKKIDAAKQAENVASEDDLSSFMQTIAPKPTPTQEAQPTTLLGDIGQGVTNFGKATWNDGNIIAGIPKAAYGIGEAVAGGGAHMAAMIPEGLYGVASGVSNMLPQAIGGSGGNFGEGYTQGAQQVKNLAEKIIPAPITNAGQAVQQIIAAPAAEFHRGGGAIGQGVENLTGSATLGGLAAAGTETLGNALMLGLPLKGKIAPEIAAAERTRQQITTNPPEQFTQPIQAAEHPSAQPVAPAAQQAPSSGLPATFDEIKARYDREQAAKAQQAPLATTPEGLAAQAETMQRPIETAPQATTAQAIAPSEGMNANAGQASVVPVNELANVADQAQAIEAPKTVTAVAPELLDITRSRPIEGGVDSALQQSRHDVLRNIGLTDGEIRAGAVAGDSRILGQEKELAKADTEAGQAMQKQLDLEQQKLTDYGDNIVRDTGGTFGAEPYQRGATIFNALDQYAKEFKTGISQAYKDAGDKVGASGINLGEFMQVVKDPANFKGGDGLSVRRDVLNTLRQRNLLNKDGTVKPINAAQAEEIRQSINESWDAMKPQSQRAVGTLVNALDESVTKNLGADEYAAAHGLRKQYADIFENPKGIAKVLDANGKDGINRSISFEKLGEKMKQLAETDSAQFDHIKQTLSNMPTTELQAAADKALGEIRAQIAEKITSAKTPAAIEKAYAPYKGSKLRQIFGEDLANKIENYVAGVGVLRTVDKNSSGTASMARNLVDKATRGGAVATGSAIGGVVSGGLGIAIGGLLGEAFAGRIKSHMLEAIDAKALNKSLSKEQFATMQKVYESKLKALGATNEMKQAKKALNDDKPDSAKQIKSLSQRIERTKQWIDFTKLLSNEQKATIKKVGVIAWLSQTGTNEETR